MGAELDKNREIDDIYQKAQTTVMELNRQQRKKAISYIKKIEQKKINELRQEVLS